MGIVNRVELARMMPDAFPIFFSGRQPYAAQALVMPEIVKGKNVLFAAPTASGKTEAAVAPLFQRHLSFRRRRLSTVYVAPTKALVNDLHERLVHYLSRDPSSIARYTGDRHELRSAEGAFCVLATPEALDSLQLRSPDLLDGVRSVIVDEIHLLHGEPRGQQLRHVISRIHRAAKPAMSDRDRFQVVGMTATLDDMNGVAQSWLGEQAIVLSYGSPREIDLVLIEPHRTDGDPNRARARSLAEWLNRSGAEKVLVFANSRNGAHVMAAHLHRELSGSRWPVHLHFGALAAVERERVEEEMRRKRYGVCVATATLEIGIDIGDIDAVVLTDCPPTVNAFLQRIGRGNRRSGTCRVVAFRSSEQDEHLLRAVLDCARRGELDDVHDFDRHSVRFQQVLSLCWRATRQDRPLSMAELAAEAGTEDHAPVVQDMLSTGCLVDVRGALIPCDRLMDEADMGRIHTVIAGRSASPVLDLRTGKTALHDADQTTAGGAVFHTGTLRRLMTGSDGGAYLGGAADQSESLARIRGTGPARPMSRRILWSLARQRGFDPSRWRLGRNELLTWGGETLNTLLAALLRRSVSHGRFTASLEIISGDFNAIELSIDSIRDIACRTENAADLPLEVTKKFGGSSQFFSEMSPVLSAEERRRSVPWRSFYEWLGCVTGIDIAG
ncbi:DEAD/DEAH box helicase [Bradyrhizobium sp. SZCCHNRI2014]|uniref:DEAD/DEAH box helicase n=1 Tax=Bradyrhizobium sp. SZCCHNRI2014 TaxID=3057285 RepID=UPI002916D8B7|nr:DEAD/DEAH box helicase [Bradyrhizobium sp. SZCCHNRI2014]